MSTPDFYVVVHGGAGVHKHDYDQQVKQGLAAACTKALQSLSSGAQSLEAIEAGICALEDDPIFNAGFGSNLTLEGKVECDAAVMEGTAQDFGSIGAVSGVKNPIKVARTILGQSRVPDKLGRIFPMTLVADGARAFAKQHLGEDVLQPPEQLVSPKALKQWSTWKRRLDEPDQAPKPDNNSGLDDIQDTVGAVAWSNAHGFAAGVSSGGLLLKHPGRIGQAATFGAGCWAQHTPNKCGMACSVSGAGEEIMRTSLAQQLASAIETASESGDVHEILKGVMEEKFAGIHRSRGQSHPNAGLVLLTAENEGEEEPRVRLWCAFTTESMAIAYASSRHPVPKAKVLRRGPEKNIATTDGLHLYITSFSI
ncbi:N-terminal nucleophile aminohydrolase [Pluteus cervinus]|uniref:N-terminal nucleophile aminohydrolase n=1 Tax=Pluteus cervinus TaxID=181527 RepID=A0ACD3B772_9AGAR|nr:N-terminal nucleophile aminohydrolase [Pluteus cervinus]